MQHIRAVLVGAAFGIWAQVVTGQAAAVTGQDDAVFEAAMNDWLADREETAIRAFSQLAQNGNPAAQIFLGILDNTPAFQGASLAALSREQRLKIMRAPGGLSGQNWMRVAANSEPLAQAWLRLWDGEASMEVVLDFARLGETRAAHMAARQLFSREKRGFSELADDPAFPKILLPLAIREWQDSAPARAKAGLARLAPGDPGRPLVGLEEPAAAELLAWAASNPQGQGLLQTLEVICPNSASKAEDLAAFLAQSGGYWRLAWIGPPSEALTDPARYAKSPKAATTAHNLLYEGMLARDELVAASPCLAGYLAARSGP